MRWITIEDFIDVYSKVVQRGASFFFSKFTANSKSRTKSAFDNTFTQSSNWWIIPQVRERWNELITGNATINYKEYLVATYFKEKKGVRVLSLGSGTCYHELELATFDAFGEIVCVDLAENRLQQAQELAEEQKLENIHFICSDLSDYAFPPNYFDMVLFNASLHHFENVEQLLSVQVKTTLKNEGVLVINEYVGPNRLQYPKEQIKTVNKALQLIPSPYRKRFKTNLPKNRYYGSGLWRMIIADPSECVDSQSILPSIHSHFTILEEKPYGGNILMSTLKDISHHFVNPNPNQEEILTTLFEFEDAYLLKHKSDFVFGVYKKGLVH
jgi:ubiquinone/menaquinone biosynthesis C-methylase UbiE